jgi:hypothetical protein
LEEMEQAIRGGSRGRKPTKAVTFDEAEEPAERQRRKTAPPSWDLFWRNFSQLSRGLAALSLCCAGRLRAAVSGDRQPA